MHLEIMRNMLYKCWIEHFQGFCKKVGGTTEEVMSTFLSFEADRRAIAITLNSVGTELTHDDKRSLFCNLGSLYPYGHQDLAPAEDFDQIVKVVSEYAPYNTLLSVVRTQASFSTFYLFLYLSPISSATLTLQAS